MNFLNAGDIVASTVGTRPAITSPLEPSRVRYSPRWITRPLAAIVPAA